MQRLDRSPSLTGGQPVEPERLATSAKESAAFRLGLGDLRDATVPAVAQVRWNGCLDFEKSAELGACERRGIALDAKPPDLLVEALRGLIPRGTPRVLGEVPLRTEQIEAREVPPRCGEVSSLSVEEAELFDGRDFIARRRDERKVRRSPNPTPATPAADEVQCRPRPEHSRRLSSGRRLGSHRPVALGARGNGRAPAASLARASRRLAREWHQTLNGELRASDVSPRSGRKVFWQCARDARHVWQASVRHRALDESGCPYCSGRRATPDTSLAAVFPELAKQWHPTRNGAVTPDSLRPKSNVKVWWQCPRLARHEWQATPGKRASGLGCPFCSNKRTAPERSLAALRPELAAEWHPAKNGQLRPDAYVLGSEKRVWWRCERDPSHEWETTIVNRGRGGHGCPFCAGQRSTPATSLARTNRRLAAEWHPTKNAELRPSDVLPGSNKAVWWRCSTDARHEWRATVVNRSLHGTSCPFCAGKRAAAETSLRALHPRLAREWHREQNGALRPDDVLPGSVREVVWQCPREPDHVWTARIAARVRGVGCPFCKSLAYVNPRLASQWHPTRNRPLSPATVTTGSGRRVWWRCEKDPRHIWKAPISSRHAAGSGCLICMRKLASPETCLARVHRELAREWHPTKNGSLTAKDVLPGSDKRVWWRCRLNPYHVWEATVYSRARRGSGCPDCRRPQRKKARRKSKLRVPILI